MPRADCCGDCDVLPSCNCAEHIEIWGSCELRTYWLDIEDSEF